MVKKFLTDEPYAKLFTASLVSEKNTYLDLKKP